MVFDGRKAEIGRYVGNHPFPPAGDAPTMRAALVRVA
tara:strand:+ start:62 stop:172 length:111 start_codon:yes stop_codon:yes gene_type:complete